MTKNSRTALRALETLELRQLLHGDPLGEVISDLDPDTSTAEFRTYDGSGNNLSDTDRGTPGSILLRVAPSDYADGLSIPAGNDRPNPREISNALSSDEGHISQRGLSAFAYVWGQFLDHDISRTPSSGESLNIPVPTGDPHFDPFGTGTASIRFHRSDYDLESGETSPREQINTITAWIDGSAIYGSDEVTARQLRTLEGGRLKTSAGDLLPKNDEATFPAGRLPMDNDARIVDDDELYAAGDVRANENIELTAMHTLFMREHNRLAGAIASEHPDWSDEVIFQQARRLVTAQLQAITYNEWLPAILGRNSLSAYAGYDASVDPSVSNAFSTAAFRFGHSLLGDDVEFLDNNGQEIAEEVPLSEAFSNPTLVETHGIAPILKYLAADPAGELDAQIVDSVRNFLFGPPGAGGLDLASLNIQRGRDHGLADLNSARVAYGLEPYADFTDISANPALQTALAELYGSVDNIDLWVGGLVEDHVPGGSVGSTFHTIIRDQFERLRDADRFWYQNAFAGRELEAIERTRLADVLERNTELSGLQRNVFFFHASLAGNLQRPPRSLSPNELAQLSVQLVSDGGELISETSLGRRGAYQFDVQDGLRTGTYQVRLRDALGNTLAQSRTVDVTTGDVHIRNLDLRWLPLSQEPDDDREREPRRFRRGADLPGPQRLVGDTVRDRRR